MNAKHVSGRLWGALAVCIRRAPSAIPSLGVAWFVAALLPVLGFVQFGNHGMADRFAYLPAIGIYLTLVQGTGDLLSGQGRSRSLAAGVAIAVLAWLGWQEVFGDDDRMGDVAVVGPIIGIAGAPLASALAEAAGTAAVYGTLAVVGLIPLLLRPPGAPMGSPVAAAQA